MNPEIAARLERLRIDSFTRGAGYYLFTRDNCAAFANDRPTGLSLGSSGLMTENGLAFLVWRKGEAYLAAHGGAETPATREEVEAVRRFSEDLKEALGA